MHDGANQGFTDYASAAAKFLGTDSAFYNGTLSFDLLFSATTILNNPNAVLINGTNGNTLGFNYSEVFPSGIWTPFSLTLNENSGWIYNPDANGAGSTPSMAQFQGILSSVSELRIMVDWRNGDEDVSIDNVVLTAAVPEPSTAFLEALAVAGLLAVRLRKHKCRAG